MKLNYTNMNKTFTFHSLSTNFEQKYLVSIKYKNIQIVLPSYCNDSRSEYHCSEKITYLQGCERPVRKTT